VSRLARTSLAFLAAFGLAEVGVGLARAATTTYVPVLLDRIADSPALIGAVMLAGAGVLGGLLLRNPRRPTAARCCPGGQIVGAPEEAGNPREAAEPAPA
jgi:hypothetical protein